MMATVEQISPSHEDVEPVHNKLARRHVEEDVPLKAVMLPKSLKFLGDDDKHTNRKGQEVRLSST